VSSSSLSSFSSFASCIGEETVKTDEEVRLINEKLADQGIAKLTTQEKKDLKLYNANIRAYADLVQCLRQRFVFDRKVSRNGNEGYLMAIKIQKENQKKTENKIPEKINAVAE